MGAIVDEFTSELADVDNREQLVNFMP